MNSSYIKSIIFTLLLACLSTFISAQIDNNRYRVILSSQDIGTCGNGNSLSYIEITGKNASCNSFEIVFTLPNGILYTPSSLTITSQSGSSDYIVSEANIANLNQPVFSIERPGNINWAVGDIVRISFERSADCDAVQFYNNAGIFKDAHTINFQDIGGANSASDYDVNIASYNLNAASLSIQSIPLVNANIGGSYSRNIDLDQGGNGTITSFTYFVVVGSGIGNYQLSHNGTNLTPSSISGDTLFYDVNLSVFPFNTGNNLFENGERITFTESFDVLGCQNTEIRHQAYWGCNIGEICQLAPVQLGSLNFGASAPIVTVTEIAGRPDFCSPTTFHVLITNTTTTTGGTAYNVDINLGLGHNQSPITTSTTNPLWAFNSAGTRSVSNFIFINGAVFSPTTRPSTFYPGNGSGNTVSIPPDFFTTDPDGAGGLDDLDGDGFYDDLPPGGSTTLTFDYTTNPRSNCGESNYYNYMSWEHVDFDVNYQDQCYSDRAPSRADLDYTNVIRNYLNPTLINSPTDVNDADNFNVSIKPHMYIGLACNGASGTSGPDVTWTIELTVPSGVSLQVGAPASFSQTGNIITYTSGSYSYSFVNFPLTYIAGIGICGGNESIIYKTNYKCGTCWDEDIHCGTINISTHASCPCKGPSILSFDAQRISEGWTDPTMSTYVTLNNTFSLDNYLAGDTMVIYAVGTIYDTTLTNLNLNIRYTTMTGGGGVNALTFIQGQIITYDNSTNTTSPVGTLPAGTSSSIGNSHTQSFDLSSYNGGIYENLDTVWVELTYIIPTTISTSTLFNLSTFRGNFYSDNGGIIKSCNDLGDAASYGRIGHAVSNYISYPRICANSSVELFLTHYASFGDLHPGEYRPPTIWDSCVAVLPPGTIFTGDAIWIGGGGYSIAGGDIGFSQSGNIVTFFPQGNFTNLDQGGTTYKRFRVYFRGTCETPTTSSYTLTHYYKEFAYGAAVPVIRTDTDVFTYTPPSFLFQSPATLVNGTGNEATFDVEICNTSIEAINFNWIQIEDNPSINIVSAVSVVGGVETPVTFSQAGGATNIEAGALLVGECRKIRFKATFTSCNNENLIVKHGWDCAQYPVDYQPISSICYQDSIIMTLAPQEGQIQLSITNQPAGSLTLCTPFDIDLDLTSSQIADILNPYVEFNIPGGITGMTINSIDVEYPDNSGLAGTSPVTYTISASGRVHINISDHPDILGQPGIMGTSNASTIDDRVAHIKINFQLECNYISNSAIIFEAFATSPCSSPALGNGTIVSSNGLVINGALPPYDAFSTINNLAPVGNTQGFNIVTTIIGGTTGVQDSAIFILPDGLTYIPSSFTSTGANLAIFGSVVTVGNHQEIYVYYPSGVNNNETIDFSLNTTIDHNVCDRSQITNFVTVNGVSCLSTSCVDPRVSTGFSYENIEASLLLAAGVDQDICGSTLATLNGESPPTGETGLWSMDATYTQPSLVTFSDATLFNSNANNLLEGIYRLVWSITNGTCATVSDTMTINVYDQPTAIAGNDQDLCAIYTTSLAGNTPPGTATGIWSMATTHVQPSVVSFTDATLFNTNISNLLEGTYKLVWTINNGTCTAHSDTVLVNVYDQPTAIASSDQNLCAIYATTLAGNTPPGTATGMWSMATTHTQPSVISFTDATLFNTNISNLIEGTYKLVWTMSNGTCTAATDTMTINVYDQPNAIAGSNQNLCNISTSTLAGNNPPGTATGMWSMATTHTQPSLVTFTDATLFNTNISNLIEGTYKLVWTINNGTCTAHSDTVLVNVYDQPTAIASSDQNLCAIYATTLAGNTPPGTATGMWSMATTHVQPSVVSFADATLFNTNVSNLLEGTYKLVWTMSNGTCTDATDTITIDIYDQPNALAGSDQDLCAIYTTTLAGNTPPGTATGMWSMATTHVQPSVVTFADATLFNTNVSNLSEGTYKLVWTMSNGTCSPATDTIIINVYDQPNAIAGGDQDLCAIYTTTLAGNTPPGTATGMWSMATTHTQPSVISFTDATLFNTNISNLIEGTYKLVWTMSNGTCSPATDTIIINVYDQPNAIAGGDQDLCAIYTTTLAGNTPPGTATGMWSMATTHVQPSVVSFADATLFNTNVSNLSEGTYKLVWTMSNGTCTDATDTIIINVYDQPNAIAGGDQDLCAIYTTTLAGNTPPGTATGMWSMATTHVQPSVVSFADATLFNTNVSNLSEGTYKLVWTMSNGTCSPATDTMTINIYDQPTAIAGSDQNLCAVYTTTLAGNNPPGTATGMWSMATTHIQPSVVTFADATLFNTNVSNLQEGTYKLVWTMSNGTCSSDIDLVEIIVYNQPNSNAGIDQDLCDVFTTNLTANTASGTASGFWLADPNFGNPSFVLFSNPTSPTTNISNLQEGTYQLIWILSNGSCTPSLDTTQIRVYDQPTSSAGNDQNLCNSYTTSLNGNAANGTANGIWTINPTYTQPSLVNFADATLFNTNISNLQEGSYQLIWTMSNGTCSPAVDTVMINIYDQPTSDAGIDQYLCSTYTTNLAGNSPQGTATGLWTNDTTHIQPSLVTFTDATLFNTNISNLQEGIYKFVWTMSNGTCTPTTDTLVISIYDQPTADAGLDQDLCNTNATVLAANIPNGSASGIWSLDPSFIQSSIVSITDVTLNSTNISNLQEGPYQLIWTISNGTCSPDIDTIQISVHDLPISSAGIDQYLCNSYTTTLDANLPQGTASGIWSLDPLYTQPSTVTFADNTLFNSNISNLQEGTYKIIWTVSNVSCTPAIDTVEISIYDSPSSYAGIDIDLCNLYNTNLAGNATIGTATGLWTIDASHIQPSNVIFDAPSLFNTNISSLQEGTYRFVWTVSNGICLSSSDIVEVRVYDQPEANTGADITICDIGNVFLEGNPALGTSTGSWSMNSSHPNPSNINFSTPYNNTTIANTILEGEYQFIWTIANGTCPNSTDTVSVLRFPRPIANFFQIDDNTCPYECIDLVNASIALPPYSITGVSWTIDLNSYSPFSTLDNPSLCIEVVGVYDIGLIATSSNGCTDTITVLNALTVNNSPISNFSFSPTENIIELDEVQITNEAQNATTIQYSFGDGNTSTLYNPIHSYKLAGDYTIIQFAENSAGCIDTSYQIITINENESVFIPNGFTPDGNGHNDIFLPRTRGLKSEINNYQLMIFDRWGNLIFETYDIEQGWDGTSKNSDMPIGVYVWQISYQSIQKDKKKTERGHVTLVR